jgi:hypothetical protein
MSTDWGPMEREVDIDTKRRSGSPETACFKRLTSAPVNATFPGGQLSMFDGSFSTARLMHVFC